MILHRDVCVVTTDVAEVQLVTIHEHDIVIVSYIDGATFVFKRVDV